MRNLHPNGYLRTALRVRREALIVGKVLEVVDAADSMVRIDKNQ